MLELRLLSTDDTVPWLSDALMELDALAVSVVDADADTAQEQALFGEPGMPVPAQAWQHSQVQALFATRESLDHALQVLQLQPDWGNTQLAAIAAVPDEDWVRLTQQQFDPVEITPTFWIVPTWHEVPAAARQVIRLDPGLAFGTGTHPTTRMCLAWLAQHASTINNARVMDYGCGSGILAIGAALHGATQVHAVDIDPSALQATLENARANQVAVAVADASAVRPDEPPFDVVLANILATPLRLLAPVLYRLVKPGGHLVLAGILARQVDELRRAYAPWLVLSVEQEQEGWVLMTAQASLSR